MGCAENDALLPLFFGLPPPFPSFLIIGRQRTARALCLKILIPAPLFPQRDRFSIRNNAAKTLFFFPSSLLFFLNRLLRRDDKLLDHDLQLSLSPSPRHLDPCALFFLFHKKMCGALPAWKKREGLIPPFHVPPPF